MGILILRISGVLLGQFLGSRVYKGLGLREEGLRLRA